MCLAESQPLGPRAEREGQGHWPGDHESPEDTRWTHVQVTHSQMHELWV